MCFTLLVHLNSEAIFSSKIFHLYLEFIKFAIEKWIPSTNIMPNLFQTHLSFPKSKPCVAF